MRVNPEDSLAGRPILEILELLKFHSDGLSHEVVEFELDANPDEAVKVLDGLLREGFVELKRDAGESLYVATLRGRALAMASAGPPISHARAEKLVNEFLARVRKVNANPDFLVGVDEVRVFGSYARGAPTVGDVDLAVSYSRKNAETYPAQAEAQVRAAKRAGHFFATYFDELSWPEDKMREFLRGDSGLLSLHDLRSEKSGPVAEAKVVLFARSGSRAPHALAHRPKGRGGERRAKRGVGRTAAVARRKLGKGTCKRP